MKINLKEYDFVGVDLHKEKHYAVLTDCFGRLLYKCEIKNLPLEFERFLQTVLEKSEAGKVIFGLEDCHFYGRALAKFLISMNQLVKEVNSSYTKKKRNQGPNKNKTDMLDALAVAKNLISEFDNLPFAKPHDLFLAIQQILNIRNNYNVMSTNIKVSLHNLLIHNYMNYKAMFKNFETKTAKGFFYQFPSPHLLNGISEEQLYKVLKDYNKTLKPSIITKIFKALEDLDLTKKNQFQAEQNKAIRSYIKQLYKMSVEIKKMEEVLDHLIEETGYPLKTIPGIDTVLAATIIANIGDISRFRKADCLAKLAGIAPYMYSSGKSDKKCSDYLGNRELNNAFYAMSLSQIRKEVNPIMFSYYEKKQKEGRSKKQAMVFVARRMVNIVYRIMKDKKAYVQPKLEELKVS